MYVCVCVFSVLIFFQFELRFMQAVEERKSGASMSQLGRKFAHTQHIKTANRDAKKTQEELQK